MSEQLSLLDFKLQNIEERETKQQQNIQKELEEQKIKEHLSKKSTAELALILRAICHPKPDFGDGNTWRGYYLEEFSRRGKQFLIDLNWPIERDSLYVNLHTGCIKTLGVELSGICGNKEGYEHVWAIIEHWEPYRKDKPNTYLIKHLQDKIKTEKENLEKCSKGECSHGMGINTEKKMAKEALRNAEIELHSERCRIKNVFSNFN